MCIFIRAINTVTKTRILVAPLPGNRQLTVYENEVTVKTVSKNCMILPVPTGQEIQLVDLSQYPGGNLWRDCEKMFPEKNVMGAGMSFGWGAGGGGVQQKTLPVHKVGGYMCSIVPTLGDFARLAQQHFQVPENISEILTKNYGQGFSFVVCMFDNNVIGHPIAYTSARLPSGVCFIPTRHAHGEDNNQIANPLRSVHEMVRCDGCQMEPLIGVRWKCLDCFDHDLCDVCFSRGNHPQTHAFVRLPIPMNRMELSEVLSGSNAIRSRNKKKEGEDEFDHTIYLVNGTILAPPSHYTYQETSTMPDSEMNVKLDRFVQHYPRGSYMTKVSIVGNFPNDDYKCVTFCK